MTAPRAELALCRSITSLDGIDPSVHVMEPKLDGIRLQVEVRAGTVGAWTRTDHVATGKLPDVEAALNALADALDGTVLDGEAVAFGPDGVADFNWTARVMGSGADKAVLKQRQAGRPVSFVAFDILRLLGTDVRHLPLDERRLLLERVVAAVDSPHVRITEQTEPSVEAHLDFTARYGEGSVVKDRRAAYQGGRSRAMLKWKRVEDEDVVVMGAEPGKGKYEGQLGAVVFGQYRDGVLVERGKCSGMDEATRRAFSDDLPVGAVMVITHNGIQAGEGFRHPQYAHLRDDKAPEDCEWTEAA